MAKPVLTVPGAPCWIDVMTSDPDRAIEFYGQLFGWTAERSGEEFGGYITLFKDGQIVAGAMQSQPDTGPPNVWSVYLATDDAQATADAATANGGRVHVPPMQVADLGSMVFLEDAGGAALGAWQAGKHTGFDVVAEPGTPAWFELHTRDYATTVDFYQGVFHWDVHVASDDADFRYTTLGEGESQQAGIMDASAFLPEGVPAHWSIYFAVADADAALSRIEQLGGSIILPAETTPYGRMAQAADPMGATFKIIDTSQRS
jgi:uncharacterized protein